MNLFQDLQALVAAVQAGEIMVAVRLLLKLIGQVTDVLDPQIRMMHSTASAAPPSPMKAAATSYDAKTIEECCDELEKVCKAHGVSAASAAPAQGPLLTIVLPILWSMLKKYLGL